MKSYYRLNPKYTGKRRFWQCFDNRLRETQEADRDLQREHVTINKTKTDKRNKIIEFFEDLIDAIVTILVLR